MPPYGLSRCLSESVKHLYSVLPRVWLGLMALPRANTKPRQARACRRQGSFQGCGQTGRLQHHLTFSVGYFKWLSDPRKLPCLHGPGSASVVWWPSVGTTLAWSWGHSGHTLAGWLGSSGPLSPQQAHPRTQLTPASAKGGLSAGRPPHPLILGGAIMPHTPQVSLWIRSLSWVLGLSIPMPGAEGAGRG